MKRFFVFMAALVFALCACQPSGDDIILELVKGDPSNLLYTYERQSVNLGLDANRSWKASGSAEWIELETLKGSGEEGDVISFTLAANPDFTYRTGEIVIKAGERELVLTVTQEPEIRYIIKENFNGFPETIEGDLPSRWLVVDLDGDGKNWHCCRDTETGQAFAYSESYNEAYGPLTPDNLMITPTINLPGVGFSIKWDSRASDPEYAGDKYKVYVAADGDYGHPIISSAVLCEEETTSTAELTHHEFNLDKFEGINICIVFRHYDSTGNSRVLITNVEVSNSR